MITQINNIQTKNLNSFRGKYVTTEQGNPYYKTNSGTKIGGTLAAIPLILLAVTKPIINYSEKSMKKAEDKLKTSADESSKDLEKILSQNRKIIENLNKVPMTKMALATIAASAVYLGCGIITDHYRNKNSAEIADKVKTVGAKNAMAEDDTIQLTDKRRPYYNSNIGLKLGVGLGAITGILVHYLNKMTNTGYKGTVGLISQIIAGVIGGVIVGAISDSMANNDTRKHA